MPVRLRPEIRKLPRSESTWGVMMAAMNSFFYQVRDLTGRNLGRYVVYLLLRLQESPPHPGSRGVHQLSIAFQTQDDGVLLAVTLNDDVLTADDRLAENSASSLLEF